MCYSNRYYLVINVYYRVNIIMETIRLQTKEEIQQFQEYIHANPSALIKEEHITGYVRKYLANDQIVELPENKYSNVLVFGKDSTEQITNISYKAGKIYKYFRNGECRVDEYKPFVLTPGPTKSGTKLKGNQFYKYITHINDDKYNELKSQWNKDIYLPRSIEEGYMMLHGYTYFKGLKLTDVSYLSFDIENLDEHNFDHKDLVVLISNTFRNNDGEITKKLFSIKDYKNSVEMVEEWCKWVRDINPDIILGHNIILHDLRIMSLVTNLNIGRDGSALMFDEKISKIRKDAQQQYEFKNALVFGREVICTWMLSIKYDSSRLFPSYGLKAIEKYLGLVDENRVEWDFTKNPVHKTLNNPELWNEFTKYSIDDADGPLKMIDIMLPSLFYLNQTIPQTLQSLNITNTGSQINNFLIRSYLQLGGGIPQSTKITEQVAGGISFAVPGIYRNLYKIDIKSCYPSQILRFKLYDRKKDPEAHYYQMVKYFTEERFELKRLYKETKDKYYKDRDATAKIFINSAYGLTITNYLNFNSPAIGAKITAESRAIIDMALKWASGNGVEYWMKLFKQKTGQIDEEDSEL